MSTSTSTHIIKYTSKEMKHRWCDGFVTVYISSVCNFCLHAIKRWHAETETCNVCSIGTQRLKLISPYEKTIKFNQCQKVCQQN